MAMTRVEDKSRRHKRLQAIGTVDATTGAVTVIRGRVPRQDFKSYPTTNGFGPECYFPTTVLAAEARPAKS